MQESLFCVGCIFCLAAQPADSKVSVIVNTDSGRIAGEINGTLYGSPEPGRANVAAFYGIPYAQPPTGMRRFRPPEPLLPWEGIRKASAPGPVCAQLPLISAVEVPTVLWPTVHEDCLYLNVWAPAVSNGSIVGKKPVIIFIHGGGFMTGSGYKMLGMPYYNAQGLADDIKIVIVTLNYRLGVFGFFADPALKAESGTTGNYGIQDQRAAMSWVQRNALAFGGDPAQITIMGESAGAASVLHHAVFPRSAGLFAQAISQSGYDITWPLEVAYSTHQKISSRIECQGEASRLQCLRNATAKALLEAQEAVFFSGDFIERALYFGPVSDGFELPVNTTFVQAMKAAKPTARLLIGTNLNETNLFLCLDKSSKLSSWQDAAKYLLAKVQLLAPGVHVTEATMEQLLQHYQNFATPREAVMAATTDFVFTCGARRIARAFTASGAPVYRYLFGRPPACFRHPSCLGVPHAAEINLLFRDAFPRSAQHVAVGDATEQQLADFMIKAWGQFAWGRSPDASWPQWNISQPTLQIGSPNSGNFTVPLGYRSDVCHQMDLLMNPGYQRMTTQKADVSTFVV